MRAIGITWLKVDPEARDLSVAIAAPDKTLPRQPLDISVAVTGAGANEEAEEPADFLLLGRTGDRHCGLELGELLDRDTKLFHCLAFPSFFLRGEGCYAREALKLC